MSQHQALRPEDVDSRVILSDYLPLSQIFHSIQKGDYQWPTVFPRRRDPLINEVSTVDHGHGQLVHVVSYECNDVLPFFPILSALLVLFETLLLLGQILMLVYHNHYHLMNSERGSQSKVNVSARL